MPSPAQEHSEAISLAGGRADAPARCCCNDAFPTRSQQQERKVRVARGVQQPLARLEIEFAAEGACDHSGSTGAHRFLRGPERFALIRGFDQREARRVEAETVEAMAVRTSAAGELFRGEDEEERRVPRRAAKQCQEETEGRGQVGVVRGGDLMYGAEGEAPWREMVVESGKAERQAVFPVSRHALHACEAAA